MIDVSFVDAIGSVLLVHVFGHGASSGSDDEGACVEGVDEGRCLDGLRFWEKAYGVDSKDERDLLYLIRAAGSQVGRSSWITVRCIGEALVPCLDQIATLFPCFPVG